MLGEIETRLQAAGQAREVGAHTGLIATDQVASEREWCVVDRHAGNAAPAHAASLQERGDDQLAKFLIVQQLFGEEEVTRGAGDGQAR